MEIFNGDRQLACWNSNFLFPIEHPVSECAPQRNIPNHMRALLSTREEQPLRLMAPCARELEAFCAAKNDSNRRRAAMVTRGRDPRVTANWPFIKATAGRLLESGFCTSIFPFWTANFHCHGHWHWQ
ncbi:hypothetical protein T4E_2941 [Trichinella pseudospiralis]|uniref:Uncharacterized protein n=1 Tax=Trichinella pseudospiralis TaxID=6337 RepID=A0A0V0XPR2_TRIPS|nr:hypothetical protein T4E_2941 [Trichinella pseudospiralis]